MSRKIKMIEIGPVATFGGLCGKDEGHFSEEVKRNAERLIRDFRPEELVDYKRLVRRFNKMVKEGGVTVEEFEKFKSNLSKMIRK